MRALVVGHGFIGSAVARALEERGHQVSVIHAPRYEATSRDADALLTVAGLIAARESPFDSSSVDVVINCAGMANPTGALSDRLVGANALLPAVLAATVAHQGTCCRMVHVSSAAVQGAGVLDETLRLAPWSAYSRSKALGEEALMHASSPVTIYRPASVHGPGRRLTESLSSFAGSQWSSVAGCGDGPSPVAHVVNVADGIAFIAERDDAPKTILHPSDGMTCAQVLQALGGRRPLHIPRPVARLLVVALGLVGQRSTRYAALARRLEVTWFGQDEDSTRLISMGWQPVVGVEAWQMMGEGSSR